mgnify:CR=1 FL=1
MRGLKDFTDEECGHTDQAWERLEALVVMIGVGLNMASKMGPNVRCRSLHITFASFGGAKQNTPSAFLSPVGAI